MVKKHIEDNPRIAPARMGKTRQRLINQRVVVCKNINAAVQRNTVFNISAVLAVQPPFDEIAIQAAKHFFRALSAQVQMCEIIHRRSLALPHLYRYNPIYRFELI